MITTQIAGFLGVALTAAAYVPQISHLITARCAAGISLPAFQIWLLASLLTTARALAIHASAFIALGGIQLLATSLIIFSATRFKNTPCSSTGATAASTTSPRTQSTQHRISKHSSAGIHAARNRPSLLEEPHACLPARRPHADR
jgi:uncharacterized protein with PQ loop repeat